MALSNRPADALQALSKAVELEPNSPTPLTQRARLEALQGDLEAALGDLQKALEVDPASISALTISRMSTERISPILRLPMVGSKCRSI